MGYTHYWWRPEHLDPEAFQAFLYDAERLLAAAAAWAGPWGAGEYADGPIVLKDIRLTPRLFSFDPADEGGGTFQVGLDDLPYPGQEVVRGLFQDHCKTNREAYDLLVCACLMGLKRHCRVVEVSSGGTVSEWAAACGFYRAVLNRDPPHDGVVPWRPNLVLVEGPSEVSASADA